MAKQKINTPGLYPMNTTKVIPTTEPQGIYFALRYLCMNGEICRCPKGQDLLR